MKHALKIIAVSLALAASAAMAQAPGGYGPGMMGGGGPGMMGYGPGMGMAALNLTEDQQDRIFALHEQAHGKNFGTMSKMRSERFKLGKLMRAENPDSKAIVEQQKKVDDLRREMLASHLEMRKEMEKVLTPEQRKQFRQMGPWGMHPEE